MVVGASKFVDLAQHAVMGNVFAQHNYVDPEPCAEDLSAFKHLDLKWLDLFQRRIRDLKGVDFRLDSAGDDDKLAWIDYFRIYGEIREQTLIDRDQQIRAAWHPSTIGYDMSKVPIGVIEEEVEEESVHDDKSADHTDDEPSVHSDEEDEQPDKQNDESSPRSDSEKLHTLPDGHDIDVLTTGGSVRKQVKRVPEWDPALVSPIYFGYARKTCSDVAAEEQKERDQIKVRELRAIDKAKISREKVRLMSACLAVHARRMIWVELIKS